MLNISGEKHRQTKQTHTHEKGRKIGCNVIFDCNMLLCDQTNKQTKTKKQQQQKSFLANPNYKQIKQRLGGITLKLMEQTATALAE